MKTILQFSSALASTPRWSHWLPLWALLLFGIYLAWRKWPSIRGLIAKRKSELSALGEPPSKRRFVVWRRRSLVTGDVGAGSLVLLITSLALGFGFVLGSYLWGHHNGYVEGQWDLTHDRFSYTDVLIVQRHNDQEYLVQPARMRAFEVKTCEPVDWEAGQMMSVFTYQQRKGCKDVSLSGSYQFYSLRGKRMSFKKEIDND